MHDICCTILRGECSRIKIRGKWHFRRAVCLHNMEHGHSDFRGSTGGNAKNAQHAQNAPHAVQRHSQRQHAAHVAQGSVGVFFLGGGGGEPQFPYHKAICSGGGGGGSTSIPQPQSNWQQVRYLLLRDTTSSLVLGADRALHVRSPYYSIIVQPRNRYVDHILRRHQSGAC